MKWSHSPRNLERLAKDFSSIYSYREPPVVNHAGTAIGLLHNTTKGTGVFIVNLADKKELVICETNDAADIGLPHIFGWSPDDATFAYRWDVKLHFTGTDGTPNRGEILAPNFAGFTWLSTNTCAYIIASDLNNENVVQLALARKIDGVWQETTKWPLTNIKGKAKSLLAVDTNTAVWLADSSIWQMNLSSGEIQQVYANTNGDITSLSYCPETKTYLFSEAKRRARTSTLFTFSNGVKKPESDSKSMIEDAQWVEHGKGYVGRMIDGDNSWFFVRRMNSLDEKKLFQHFQIYDVFCHGNDSRIYVFASQTNEAPNLWQCDVVTGTVNHLLTPWWLKDVEICFQPTLDGYAPMPNKHFEHFVLLPPANFSRQKKYPLVIGMQGYDWMNVAHATYSQVLANSGCYVALTGYHYTHQSMDALIEYTNNVLAVYDQMIKTPNVDPKQVYIFAFSSSTIVVNRLLESHSGHWHGAMLLNPTADLPKLDSNKTLKLLVTAGSDEEWLWKKFPNYKKAMAQDGISVETYIHPDTGHIERSQNTLYERAMLMGKFIFE